MALHLIRHASAGDRSVYSGDDLSRPLDRAGQRQAMALVDYFADTPIRSVWSSEATRCRQTVAPLAAAHSLEVVGTGVLTEGASCVDLVESIREQSQIDNDMIMCSHGDLIPEALGTFLREGMVILGERGCEKGSIWTLEAEGGNVVRGSYTARP